MKKLVNICLFILCLISIGCNDHEEESATSSFRVISARTSLPAVGGNGEIELSVSQNFTVNSTEDWCLATISGNRVELSVSSNEEIEGRSALITISYEQEQTTVPVTQLGAIFADNLPSYRNFSAENERQAYYIKSNLPYEISYQSEWLSHEVEGDSIIFTSVACGSESLAQKIVPVTILCGKRRETMIFSQINYTDLLGKYEFKYMDKSGENTSLIVQLVKYQPNKYVLLDGPMDGAQLSIEYDNGRLVFSAGQYLGAVAPNFIYSCIIANTQDITWEKRCQYVATPKLESEKVTFSFTDNGTFPGATAVGLFFAAFSLKEPAANVYVGGLNQAINIVMTKQ